MINRKSQDKIAQTAFSFFAALCVAVLLGIFLMLAINAARFIFKISPAELFSKDWNPSAYEDPHYGIVSMVVGSLLTTFIAMLIAVPIGIGTAGCLSELMPPPIRAWMKPFIEMLGAIPSVVIGFLGITIVGPFLANIFGLPNGLNALNGSLLLAVMALPTIITIAEDAIHSVPKEYKEASYALGGSVWTTFIRITLPSCYSGLVAAVVMGLGRAMGETMAVLMVTGNANSIPGSIFDPVRTLSATIAIEMGDVPFNSQHYYGLFACGLVLFGFTLGANILAEKFAHKYRKRR